MNNYSFEYSSEHIKISPALKQVFKVFSDIDNELNIQISNNNSVGTVRINFIAYFSYLEFLRCCWTSYDLETYNETTLRKCKDKYMYKFLNEFLFTKENNWYNSNSEFKRKIKSKDFVLLRNCLVHFFSMPEYIILLPGSTESHPDLKKYYNKINPNIYDFNCNTMKELTSSIVDLFLKKLSSDQKNNRNRFQRKISFVDKVIAKHGARSVKNCGCLL